MRQVQEALANLGIPVYPDVWRSENGEFAPAQYVVYVANHIETDFWDGAPHTLLSNIYMNLWSMTPPTQTAETLKTLMWSAGFEMKEELTGNSYNSTRYDEDIQYYCVSWTWVLREAYTRPTLND